MPIHKKGQNNTRKNTKQHRKQLDMPEHKQDNIYAIVDSAHGNCRFTMITKERTYISGTLCRNVKNAGRVSVGELVLISALGTSQNTNYEIMYRYTPIEKKKLETTYGVVLNYDELKSANAPVVETKKIEYGDDIIFGRKDEFKYEIEKQTQKVHEEDNIEMIKDLYGTNTIDDI
jgi:translation initiation factor IF-1